MGSHNLMMRLTLTAALLPADTNLKLQYRSAMDIRAASKLGPSAAAVVAAVHC
jgi:hypothetical protein